MATNNDSLPGLPNAPKISEFDDSSNHPKVTEVTTTEKYLDDKERILADTVKKMQENRHTSGTDGFKKRQKEQNEEIMVGLLSQARQVKYN